MGNWALPVITREKGLAYLDHDLATFGCVAECIDAERKFLSNWVEYKTIGIGSKD